MTFRDTANQFAALCALFGAYATVGPAYGSVVSGTISEWRESTFSNQIGDGQHNLSVFWSYNTIHRGFFYDKSVGSSNGGGSGAVSVAYVSGVTDISQISDASIFSPTSYSVGPLCDATCSRTGVGSFLVWKSEEGYYGVLRVDSILGTDMPVNGTLNGAWWFQTDRTAVFSSVPEPSVFVLLLLGFVPLSLLRHRASAHTRERKAAEQLRTQESEA